MPTLLNSGASPWGWHKLESMFCPRRYGLNEAGANQGYKRPLVLGSLVHLGIGHYYRRLQATQQGTDPDAWYEPFTAVDLGAHAATVEYPQEAGAIEGLRIIARDVTEAYAEHWSGREQIEIMHVEEVCSYRPQGAPWALTSRVDLIFRSRGLWYLCDHKSAGRVTSAHARFYSRSGQFLLYHAIGSALFRDSFGGVVLNMVQVGQDQWRFERPPLLSTPARHRDFPRTVTYFMERVADLKAQGVPPHEWPCAPSEHTCEIRYGACDHAERCDWGWEPEPGAAFSHPTA